MVALSDAMTSVITRCTKFFHLTGPPKNAKRHINIINIAVNL